MREKIRFLKLFLVLIAILVLGTIGYALIEGWPLLDALYMTIITISTVGYGEVHTLSPAGKMFSSVLILCGVGTAFYIFTSVVEYVIRGNLRNLFGRNQTMDETISKLTKHYIICAYGRVARVIANRFKSEGIEFVVIDIDSDAIERAKADECLCIQGDASSEEILIKAGIEKAHGMLVVTDNDATNTFIIVTARHIRKDITIVARAGTAESEAKLEIVGADRAMNPYSSVGERMARSALHPVVGDFLEDALPGPGKDRFLEGVEVAEQSTICGQTIDQAQKYSRGAVILAIRQKGSGISPKPSEDTIIGKGDRLVVLGTKEQVSKMEQLVESD